MVRNATVLINAIGLDLTSIAGRFGIRVLMVIYLQENLAGNII